MKRATTIEETEKGFIVWVKDGGFTPMRDYINGEWKIVFFPSMEDAQRAKDDYNETWSE